MISAALKHMLAAGMDHDAIVAAVADMEASIGKDAQAERRREKDRIRKAEARLRKSAESADDADPVSPKKENTPTPPKEKTTPSSSEAKASSVLSPRGELEIVLDADRAKAVVDHRQRIGKPLTAYAARQLAAKMARCPDPNLAADEMLANGWQGFKPEWLESRQPRGTSPPKQSALMQAAQSFFEEKFQ